MPIRTCRRSSFLFRSNHRIDSQIDCRRIESRQIESRAQAGLFAIGLAGLLLSGSAIAASVGNCASPSASIISNPLDIASCAGQLEVLKNGIDQVYARTSGPTFYMNGQSFGYTDTYTGGATGSQGNWTHVSSAQLGALSFRDDLRMTPTFAGAGQAVNVVQTVTYIAGNNLFDIRWDITNNTSTAITDMRVLHSCDSFVQGDDQGDYGELDWGTGTVGLRDDTPPPSLFQGLSAQKMLGDASVGALHFYTANFPVCFDQVRMGWLPDTIDIVTKDQAIALEYDKATALLPGQTWTINHLWIFDFPAVLFQVRILTECLPCGRNGQAYSWTFEGSGGSAPYTWSALDPLPPGLSLNSSTGELAGTLAAPGQYMFDILLTDSVGISFIKRFTFDGDCQPTCLVKLCGDCDDNGFVDVIDSHLAVKSAVGLAAPWTPIRLANCNVHRRFDPDPVPDVSVLDGLWIAQSVVGLRNLDCCAEAQVLDTLQCGDSYCGSFDVGDATGDLSHLATTHYVGLPSMPYGRGITITVEGTGNVDLYVGAPGTAIGDTNTSSYAISATGAGSTETLVIDAGSSPSAAAFWNMPVAVAIKGVTAGAYSLSFTCDCNPVDITGTRAGGGGIAFGDTSLQGSDLLDGSCGGMGSPEFVYRFDITVPNSDIIISTDNPGTTSDTIITVLQGGCDDSSGAIGCANNPGGAETFTLFDMPVGTIYVVVDSSGGGGPYELTIDQVPSAGCPPLTLDGNIPPSGPWPHIINDTTIGQDDSVTVDCGSGGGPDRIYLFVPAVTQRYDIDTCAAGTNYDSILQIRRGHCRIGTTIACNDDQCGNRSGLYEVLLTAGEEYFIIVDGYSTVGNFSLRIQPRVVCSTGTCAGSMEGMINSVPRTIMGSTAGADSTGTLLPSGCSLGGGPDHVYEFRPPVAGIAQYTIALCDAGTTYNASLAIRKCNCLDGAILFCDSSSCPAGPGSGDPRITINLDSTQVYYIVVDGYGMASGPYVLRVTSP